MIASREWLSPKLIGEILGRSELVVASSLHACITGVSYGVPVVRVPGSNSSDQKFKLLNKFQGVANIHDKKAGAMVIQHNREIEPEAVECADRLDRYWDQVMDVICNPSLFNSQRSMRLMLGWAAKIFGDIETAALTARP